MRCIIETQSWIRPQNDPYRLENFQQAYDNIVSGESKIVRASDEFAASARSVRKEFSATAKTQLKLKATHYALKIFPKTEEEQRSLELDEQIKIAYTPFNYTSLPDEATQSLVFSKFRTQFCEEDEERRYSVTYEGGMIKDGPVEPVTIILPVLYAVWPVEKTFPVEMDFEILYEVFLPKYITLGENGLSAEAIQILEQEAIALALDEERHLPGGFPRGKVLCYDTHLNRYVPLENLKIRFTLGSSIDEVYTDKTGYYAINNKLIDNQATVSFVFQHEKWTIVKGSEEGGRIEEIKGIYGELRSGKDLNFNINSSSAPDPRYEIHRAVNFYHYGEHDFIISTFVNNRISIVALAVDPGGWQGRFNYWPTSVGRMPFIQVGNCNRNNHPRLIGTTLHELGHYCQFHLRGGTFSAYDGTWNILLESYASYAGWHMGEAYYLNQGWKKTSLNSDITGQARQEWDYQNTTNNYYTPLFVDLVDDYNQGVGYPSRCYDQIKMPQFVVNLFGAYRTWNDFESALRKYTGSYFTENQINEFLFYERSWLQRNGYI